MKKYWILAVAALAACNNETLVETQDVAPEKDVAIAFGTDINKLTRGAENSGATGTNGLEAYHSSFQIWGYKNIARETDGEFNNIQVFGTGGAGEEVTYKETPDEYLGDWYYTPLRFWDKTATSYEFHAAAPMDAMTWTETMVTSKTGVTTGEGLGNFTKTGFELKGESLPLANATKDASNKKAVTTQPNDVFGKSTTNKDVDLMIATDVLEESLSSITNETKIALNFNHILSRLNIGVNIGKTFPVRYEQKNTMVTYDGSSVQLYSDGTDKFVKVAAAAGSGFEAQKVTVTDGEATKTSDPAVAWDDATYKIVTENDKSKPQQGIVLLKEVKVYNLYSKGNFDESKASGTTLSGGTALRWKDGTTSPSVTTTTFGFPNGEVTGKEDADEDNNTLNLSKDFICSEKDYTRDDYKLVYQGLTIPQVVKYEEIKVDGSNISTAKAPYIKIVYTIDGQEFVAYYNLAAVFQTKPTDAGENYATTTGRYVCINLLDGSYIYFGNGEYTAKDADPDATENPALTAIFYKKADGKYYDASDTEYFLGTDNKLYETEAAATAMTDGTAVDCDAIIEKDAAGEVVYLTNQAYGVYDITFCEGWQNNLWITIDPILILFEADVYEWATKTEHDLKIE